MPPALNDACRALDLTPVLGIATNVAEFLEIFKLIERNNFSRYPEWMSNRGKVGNYCLGRQCASADYVFYCPREKRIMTNEELVAKRHRGRSILHLENPRGCNYDVEVPPLGEHVSYNGGEITDAGPDNYDDDTYDGD